MDADFLRNWNRQVRKGLLELAILNDIRRRGMYGYEIERKFRKTDGLCLNYGALYHILERLRRQNLVRSTETVSPEGPKRKYYDLTEKGRMTLVQMNARWQAIKRQMNSVAKS
jgi:PadR family transcriptional regulator, regulatory protein PadR